MTIEKFLNGDRITLTASSPGRSGGPAHDGGYIALIEDGESAEGFRRLAFDDDRDVAVLQVACSCGWRSSRFNAPPGTRWIRRGVGIEPGYLTDARALLDRLWSWHLREPIAFGN